MRTHIFSFQNSLQSYRKQHSVVAAQGEAQAGKEN